MADTLSASVMEQMHQSETAFKNVMHEFFNQQLNGPVPLSLLEYTENVMDIRIIVAMTDDEADDLYYFVPEVDTSSPTGKEDDVKPQIKMVRKELSKGYKRLVKVFTSFCRYLQEEGIEIRGDWSNVSHIMFDDYRLSYNGNVTTPAPSRLVKPDEKKEPARSNTSYHQSPVEQFKKSIKRDKSDFTVLKDKKQLSPGIKTYWQ